MAILSRTIGRHFNTRRIDYGRFGAKNVENCWASRGSFKKFSKRNGKMERFNWLRNLRDRCPTSDVGPSCSLDIAVYMLKYMFC